MAVAYFFPALTRLMGVFFPVVCANCKKTSVHGEILCCVCLQNIKFMRDDMCTHCGVLIPEKAGVCDACAVSSRYALESKSVFVYDDASKHMVLRFKFLDDLCHLRTYALWMAKTGEDMLKTASLIIPVPIHRTRLFWRKYNQSALLALHVGKICTLPVNVLTLKKVVNTKLQHHLDLSQRAKNVQGSFRVTSPYKVLNQSIVLIDDIITTGETAKECAKTLLGAGAKDVRVLTLGRTLLGR